MKATYLYLILFFLFSSIVSYSQEPADALRYSFLSQPGGTARNQAIGGAGGSLGGEFTSLFINPAGLGFYKTGDFAITPSFSIKNSKSSYLGSPESAKDNRFSLGTTGFILAGPSQGGKIKSFAVGFGINRVADFNNHIYYKGKNNTSSYSEKYLDELIDNNVTDPNKAGTQFPLGTSLAYNTFLINPVFNADGSLHGYSSLANPTTGLLQENTINTSGGITDVAIGTGFNLKDKWYFGGTLSFPFLRYNRDASYKESDASGNPNNNFNYFEANESLQTKGIGINGKFGVIFKPVEDVRLGLALHTPTFYGLTDDYTTEVITDLEGFGNPPGVKHQSSTDLSNGQPLETKYNLTTPWRAILSGSYIFHEVENVQNQKGFVTADIEYVNYRAASFHAINNDADEISYFNSLNKTIGNLYKNAINVRLGGELKFNTLMVRLGGAYYGNPYQNESANLIKASGGLGYRNKGMFIDLTYVYSMNKDTNYPYRLDSEDNKSNIPAYLKNNSGNIVFSIGFKIL
ncbi:MAG: aromatic hydrocarbon degradation protein [Ginsengibacter sp.]